MTAHRTPGRPARARRWPIGTAPLWGLGRRWAASEYASAFLWEAEERRFEKRESPSDSSEWER